MYWHDMAGWSWVAMSPGMLLVWSLIAWGVVMLVRGHGPAVRPQDVV